MMKYILLFLLTISFSLPLAAQGRGGDPLGSNEFLMELRVYPNPSTTGNFSVRFSAPAVQEEITIKVYNLIGKQVFKRHLTNLQGEHIESISLQAAPKGVYLLEVSNGEHKQTRRLSLI